jgi:peroxiredoxin
MQTQALRLMAALGLTVTVCPTWAQEGATARRPAGAQPTEASTAPVAKIGQEAPDFTLLDYNGKKYQLASLTDKVVVLEWLNQQCPFSVGNVPVMKELRKKYAGKDIVWLGIESTHWRKPEENAQYAKEKELDFPILMDADGTVGRMYGAKVTPHIFVVNKGKLVYAGAVRAKTEGNKPDASSRNYLDETLSAVLDGKVVPVAETTPWGCSVKYKTSGEDKKDQAASASKL